ncbi:DUF4265 domain-containing protein [Corallococcus interemptor]|uniref:DUF4265 domain-containing protein n=1 Tax=Corallococcus interemptor TaxID=2316720 RepID=UPI003D08E8D4
MVASGIAQLLGESDKTSIRIVVHEGREPAANRSELKRPGCASEFESVHGLIAVPVPGSASLEAVRQYLEEAVAAG